MKLAERKINQIKDVLDSISVADMTPSESHIYRIVHTIPVQNPCRSAPSIIGFSALGLVILGIIWLLTFLV